MFEKAKIPMVDNVHYKLKDKYGNTKQLFQWNILGKFLAKFLNISNLKWNILGSYTDEMIMKNLVTDAGKAGIASRINGATAEAVFDYIAIGTGTTAAAAGDTALVSEITTGGGARAQDASPTRETTDVTNDTAVLDVTYTFTSSFAVTESGVLNAASAGTLLNRQVFSAINVVNTDVLTVTHKFDID